MSKQFLKKEGVFYKLTLKYSTHLTKNYFPFTMILSGERLNLNLSFGFSS